MLENKNRFTVFQPLKTIVSLVMTGLAFFSAIPSAVSDEIKVFNAMIYRDMPNFGTRLVVVYEQHFFKHGLIDGSRLPVDEGIENAVKNARDTAKFYLEREEPLSDFVAIDIERWHLWPWVTIDEHVEAVREYASVVDRFIEEGGGPSVCLYNVFPQGGISVAGRARTDSALNEEWLSANRQGMSVLSGSVSAVCPALYTYYDGAAGQPRLDRIEEWKRYATDTVELARLIAPELPVYSFIWPQFHHGGGIIDWPYMSEQYWEAQLDHLDTLVDGIILWGGWDMIKNEQQMWDENAKWWQAVKRRFPEILQESDSRVADVTVESINLRSSKEKTDADINTNVDTEVNEIHLPPFTTPGKPQIEK